MRQVPPLRAAGTPSAGVRWPRPRRAPVGVGGRGRVGGWRVRSCSTSRSARCSSYAPGRRRPMGPTSSRSLAKRSTSATCSMEAPRRVCSQPARTSAVRTTCSAIPSCSRSGRFRSSGVSCGPVSRSPMPVSTSSMSGVVAVDEIRDLVDDDAPQGTERIALLRDLEIVTADVRAALADVDLGPASGLIAAAGRREERTRWTTRRRRSTGG